MSTTRVEHTIGNHSRRRRVIRWFEVTSFIDALFEPERHCSCGHHEGSHCHGFSNQACMWCDCRVFVDPDRVSVPTGRREPAPLRHFFASR